MANDPITGGLTLAEKLFSFFTGEKWDEIRKRREGDRLEAACNETLHIWRQDPTQDNWKAYKNAVQKLDAHSNRP
jgi:hypothetical protein